MFSSLKMHELNKMTHLWFYYAKPCHNKQNITIKKQDEPSKKAKWQKLTHTHGDVSLCLQWET